MEKIKKINRLIWGTSLITGLMVKELMTKNLIFQKLLINETIAFILSILVVIIIFVISQFILLELINLEKIRKMLLRGDFLEGKWIEIVFDSESNNVVSYGLKNISGHKNSLIYDGDNYAIDDLVHTGSYCSTSISFDYPYLNYTYKYDKNDHFNTKEGIGRLKFVKRGNKEPLIHTGFFIDLEDKKKYNIYSWKIKGESLKKLDNPETFKKLFSKTLTKMKNEMNKK